jgi:hypothetical protein
MSSLPFRIVIAWILAVLASWLAVGFLGNFYPSFMGILLVSVFLQLVAGSAAVLLVKKAEQFYSSQPVDFWLLLSLFAGLVVFALRMFGMLNQFPRIFEADYVLLESGQGISFLLSSITSLLLMVWQGGYWERIAIKYSHLTVSLNRLWPGLILAAVFLGIYFPMAVAFNQPAFDVDDIFFDTDGLLWRMRFTTDAVRDYYWRSVHPFVLLLIRPLVTFVSIFLKGDKLAAAYMLVSLTGAVCVFLLWYFIKRSGGTSLYAVLIASIFGVSASHLIFGSLIETYIFLAAVALLFMVLLLKDAPFIWLLFAGVASFGITVSNFVQPVIAFLLVKRDFKAWAKYGMSAAALVIVFTLLNNFIYPDSQPYFFMPSTFGAEAANTFAPSLQRGFAIVRVMFLYSVVAPNPLILEEEIPFLKVWMFKAEPMRMGEYDTSFGTMFALFWLALLFTGGFLFLKNFKRQDNRFLFTLGLILLFNFFLHLRYGKEIFLYSTNWTYALFLFLALVWRELADKRWFQAVLMVFLALLMMNNAHLVQTMLTTASMHIQ